MLFTRRHFLGSAGAALVLGPSAALGEYQCGPFQMGGRRCSAGVSLAALTARQAATEQEQSQWCWAACISMVFRFHGFRVSQSRIVQETFGSLVNMPAGSGATISREINRSWNDDSGRSFTSRLIAAYDFDSGIAAIDNAFIATTLAAEKPIILGARSHAMVLTRVEYMAGGPQPIVFGATVLDPWPGNGMRALQSDELVARQNGGSLRYLAALEVS